MIKRGFIYRVETIIEFSFHDILTLYRYAILHYDEICRSAAEPSNGLLYKLLRSMPSETLLSINDLNVLCKICEQDTSAEIASTLAKYLHEALAESKRLNENDLEKSKMD